MRPASAPIETGVKGGRNVVVPAAGIPTPRSCAIRASAIHVAGLTLIGSHAERGVAL